MLGHIKSYYNQSDKWLTGWITFFTGGLVFFNYRFGLEKYLSEHHFPVKLISWFGVFVLALGIPYLITYSRGKQVLFRHPRFLFLLLTGPLIFAFKISFHPSFTFSPDPGWNNYWNHIVYWPVLALLLIPAIWIIWKSGPRDQPFYGFSTRGLDWRPYGLMLLIMLPLLLLASTQPDFQAVYPKIKSLGALYEQNRLSAGQILLYELSYGTDFLTIEAFFRGFLILAFVRYAGRDAILPMACFYCTIHFGKPLGECISSYFGGILLGILVYHTRTIYGGLLVHLGIAWLMEAVGYINVGHL